MDFINKAYAQLTELLGTMSAGMRLATGLLLAVVVISLAYLMRYPPTGDGEYLLGGRPFSGSELTAIEAAFASAGLGKSQVEGNRIRIPRGQKDVYLAALADGHALPADFYKYLDEATAADSPFASSKSLEMRRWNAKQKELALILSKMKNIESATVQYDEEIKQGLTRQKQKTAMVAVHSSGGRLDSDQVKAIRNIVASSYAGLERNNITITDIANGLSYGGAIGPDGVPEDESLYATHKERYERDWQRKISEQLSYIGGLVVGVNVELNPEVDRASQSIKYDPKPVTVRSTETQKDSTSQTPHPGGRPGAQVNGVQGNQPIAVQQSTTAGAESQTTESSSETQNLPGQESIAVHSAGLTPKSVTASIEVPASYFVQVWKQKNPPAAGEQPKAPEAGEIAKLEVETHNKIKETVRNLLPVVMSGTNPYPHIVVSTYTDIPALPPTPPGTAEVAGTWLAENWKMLALVGLGLASLGMIRSMVRSPAGTPQAAAVASSDAAAPNLSIHEAPEDEETEQPKILRNRMKSKGVDLKSELHEIVKENPDAAATVLRSWIGEAA